MSDLLYNILWIDDDHEFLGSTKGRARRNGVNLIGYKSLNAGMGELERNYPFYDGVLLDAKFFENEDDVKGTEDTQNVHRAKEQLLTLTTKKKFEIFILTGQAEAYGDSTFNKAFTRVYKKGSDEEFDRLLNDIKQSARSQEDTQIRHSFKRVFDVCTDKYIGEFAGQDLLNLLKINNDSEIDKNLSTIRDIVQDLISAFHKFNLLPQEFVNPSVALNESSKFLSGRNPNGSYFIERGYKHLDETHIPRQISGCLRNILATTQPGSHRSEIDVHIRMVRTHYLMKSVLFQLLDVLIWFRMYVDSNPKTGNWVKLETTKEVTEQVAVLIAGKVLNLNPQKGFAFFKPDFKGDNILIPPHLVSSHSLSEGINVYVEIEEYNDNRTGEIKKRVKCLKVN